MKEAWTGRLIGRMHNEGVTYEDLATELNCSKAYICQILNCRRTPKDAKKRLEGAYKAILNRREAENLDSADKMEGTG